MPRLQSDSESTWIFQEDDPCVVYNARLVSALLSCVFRLPGTMPGHVHDELGAAVAPLLPGMGAPPRAELQRAIKRLIRNRASAASLLDDDDDEVTDPGQRLTLVGHVLSEGGATATLVFNDMQRRLGRFLNCRSAPTDHNVQLLAQVLDLSIHERALVKLVAAATHGTVSKSIFAFVPSGARVCRALQAMLDVPLHDAERMIRPVGRLAQCGLLEALVALRGVGDLDDLLAFSALGQRLLAVPFNNAAEMADAVLQPFPSKPDQQLLWPHLAQVQDTLARALRAALDQGTPGINILLHGGPGTGKTEFARQLTDQVGAMGYLVGHEDERGDEGKRADRLASLRLSQCFAGQRERALLVLDEAEDIFQHDYQSPLSRIFGGKRESKAWTNHLLESNAHPVIWISNDAGYLDPAYLRRFTFCLEFPATPLSVRQQVAQAALAPVGCTPETIAAIAADEGSTPALLASAAKFAALASSGGASVDVAAQLHLRQQAQAMGRKAPTQVAARTQRFDLRYLNLADGMAPQQLITALRNDPVAALVFSGPPGTGKTQLAAELAMRLDRQLVLRTASDLNSMWYGQSEANVASMFRQCDPKSELLFLDEADVLLSAREDAGHRVDRAVTAEFLRWLECFEGTFICATNFASDLDAALMRRFTFRLRFMPLSVLQRQQMYAEQALGWDPAKGLPVPCLDTLAQRRLERLDRLTPGDFANAGRRLRRLGLGPEAWLDELESEHAAKAQTSSARIGFV